MAARRKTSPPAAHEPPPPTASAGADLTQPMTVVRLDVDSFQRIRAAHVTPSPVGLVPVRGRNRQGKSSLIGSMLVALGGKRETPEVPITEGEHGASIAIDLGEIVVKKRFTRDSAGNAVASLTVEAADGSRIASPQAVLDSLRSHFADPVAFIEMAPLDQAKTILRVLGLSDRLDALEGKVLSEYETRRDLGRDADRIEKAVTDLAFELQGIPAPRTMGTIEELSALLEAANKHNAAVDALGVSLQRIADRGLEKAASIDRVSRAIAAHETELAGMRLKLAELEEARAADRAAYAEVRAAIAASDPKMDTAEIHAGLAGHEEATKFRGKQELLEQKRAEAAEARKLHQASDAKVEALRKDIATLIEKTPFPVEGMTYDADNKRILINGVPFSQASSSEQMQVAAKVAMAGNPRIRVIFARAGSLLDDDAQRTLAELAEAEGFQVWLEIVDSRPEGVGIWIEDGMASQPEEPQ